MSFFFKTFGPFFLYFFFLYLCCSFFLCSRLSFFRPFRQTNSFFRFLFLFFSPHIVLLHLQLHLEKIRLTHSIKSLNVLLGTSDYIPPNNPSQQLTPPRILHQIPSAESTEDSCSFGSSPNMSRHATLCSSQENRTKQEVHSDSACRCLLIWSMRSPTKSSCSVAKRVGLGYEMKLAGIVAKLAG